MNAVVYANNKSGIPIYQQYNEMAQYSKRYGYSISGKVLDFEGNDFYRAVDKVVFDNDITSLIIYNSKSIGDFETVLFYRIYLQKFGKKLIICN